MLGREGNFLMCREILAMILDHVRTTSKDEVLFNASHIYKLQYRGDKEMDKFLNAWIEIIANMKVEDIPSDNTLRDHLLRKIDGSQALHVDLTIFKGRDNDDKKKTYKELLEIMKRHIARAREDRNTAARDKFATDYTNLGKPTTPAPKPAAPTPAPKDGKTGKPSAPVFSASHGHFPRNSHLFQNIFKHRFPPSCLSFLFPHLLLAYPMFVFLRMSHRINSCFTSSTYWCLAGNFRE